MRGSGQHYGAAMAALSISTVIPVDDMTAGVAHWTALLGVEPTFVDGDRWAQFDVNGTRVSLAGADRSSDDPGVLVKVDDLDARVATLREVGIDVTDPETGPHERRVVLGDGLVTLYEPL